MTVVLAEDVRENEGAAEVRLEGFFGWDALPIARPDVIGRLLSFLGIGESLRVDRADWTRAPGS